MNREIMQHCYIEAYVNVECDTNSEQAAKDIKEQLKIIRKNSSYIRNAEVETEYIRLTVGTAEIKVKYEYDVPVDFVKGYPATLESPGEPDYFDILYQTPEEMQKDMSNDVEAAIKNAGFELIELEVTDWTLDDNDSLMDELANKEEQAYQDRIDRLIDEMRGK